MSVSGRPSRAVQYLRMSTEPQRYSFESQAALSPTSLVGAQRSQRAESRLPPGSAGRQTGTCEPQRLLGDAGGPGATDDFLMPSSQGLVFALPTSPALVQRHASAD